MRLVKPARASSAPAPAAPAAPAPAPAPAPSAASASAASASAAPAPAPEPSPALDVRSVKPVRASSAPEPSLPNPDKTSRRSSTASSSRESSPPSTPFSHGLQIGTLVAVIIRARHLPDRHVCSKQNVYTRLTLNGSDVEKTSIEVRGGQHPEWDEELRFPIYDNADELHRMMRISIWEDKRGADLLVGEGTMDICRALRHGEFDDWILLSREGVQRGEIYVELTYFRTHPAHAKSLPIPASSRDDIPEHVMESITAILTAPSPIIKVDLFTSPLPLPSKRHSAPPGPLGVKALALSLDEPPSKRALLKALAGPEEQASRSDSVFDTRLQRSTSPELLTTEATNITARSPSPDKPSSTPDKPPSIRDTPQSTPATPELLTPESTNNSKSTAKQSDSQCAKGDVKAEEGFTSKIAQLVDRWANRRSTRDDSDDVVLISDTEVTSIVVVDDVDEDQEVTMPGSL